MAKVHGKSAERYTRVGGPFCSVNAALRSQKRTQAQQERGLQAAAAGKEAGASECEGGSSRRTLLQRERCAPVTETHAGATEERGLQAAAAGKGAGASEFKGGSSRRTLLQRERCAPVAVVVT